MFVEVGLEGKRLMTPLALVVLERGVSLHVCPQIGTVSKCLATVSAAEWLLSCVRSHVSLKEPWTRK